MAFFWSAWRPSRSAGPPRTRGRRRGWRRRRRARRQQHAARSAARTVRCTRFPPAGRQHRAGRAANGVAFAANARPRRRRGSVTDADLSSDRSGRLGANELHAAIQRAVRVGRVRHERLVEAVALRDEARRRDAVRDEVRPHRVGARLRQLHVVRRRRRRCRCGPGPRALIFGLSFRARRDLVEDLEADARA